MKILYHHRTLADGAEGVHILAMVRAFQQLGHEVQVMGLAAGTDSRRTSTRVERARSLLPTAAFELASAALNAPEYISTRAAIRRFDADIVYKRHARFDMATVLAARSLGVPVVLEVNCVYAADDYARFEPLSLPWLERWFEARALAGASLVVAVSSPLAREIRALAPANVVVIPNGVDPDLFNADRTDGSGIRTRYGLDDATVVGWTGIVREWHGLELLAEAVAGMERCTLMIVGDGPAVASLERRAADLGMSDRLIVTGRVPHDQVPQYVAAFDVAVVAGERTGVASPMKLLEYMAMAKAVIAPRAANIEDLVRDQFDGLLFEPGSLSDLSQVLRRVVTDETFRRQLGAQARLTVEQKRTWTRIAAQVLTDAGSATSR